MNWIKVYFNDFISLIFPKICYACGKNLVSQEHIICVSCDFQLPYTNFYLDKNNQLFRQFWGRVSIESADAYLYFKKRGRVQNLMHHLKYKNQPEIGVELGRRYGNVLKQNAHYKDIEAIIPVPLHHKKLYQRGYNQSAKIAEGLSASLNLPVVNVLERVFQQVSQTKTERKNRFENTEKAFVANENSFIEVLLVDDTITTGATLEACVMTLLNSGIEKVHVAGIAYVA